MDEEISARRRILRRALLLLFLLGMLFSGGAVRAQEGGGQPGLTPGEWTATANASGVAAGSPGDMSYVWTGGVEALFQISVPTEGVATGTWAHNGSSDVVINGSLGGDPVTINAVYNFLGSEGTVTGTNRELQLLGNSQSIGSMDMTVAGQTHTAPINSTDPLPMMNVDIIHATCQEAYGNWAWTVEQVFQGVRLSADLVGVFWGFKTSPGLEEQIEGLSPPVSESGDLPENLQGPLYTQINLYMAETEVMLSSWPAWNMDEVMQALTEAERLLNELRNLTPCEERFLDEGAIEEYSSALTFLVQQLVSRIAEEEDLRGKDILQILEVSTRVGATGSGAPNPGAAAAAENSLRQAAEGVLEANLDGETGELKANQDTIQIMLAGVINGWTYTAGEQEYIPAEALPELQIQQAQAGGES